MTAPRPIRLPQGRFWQSLLEIGLVVLALAAIGAISDARAAPTIPAREELRLDPPTPAPVVHANYPLKNFLPEPVTVAPLDAPLRALSIGSHGRVSPFASPARWLAIAGIVGLIVLTVGLLFRTWRRLDAGQKV